MDKAVKGRGHHLVPRLSIGRANDVGDVLRIAQHRQDPAAKRTRIVRSFFLVESNAPLPSVLSSVELRSSQLQVKYPAEGRCAPRPSACRHQSDELRWRHVNQGGALPAQDGSNTSGQYSHMDRTVARILTGIVIDAWRCKCSSSEDACCLSLHVELYRQRRCQHAGHRQTFAFAIRRRCGSKCRDKSSGVGWVTTDEWKRGGVECARWQSATQQARCDARLGRMHRMLVSIQKIEQVLKLGEGHTVVSTGEELRNAHVIARQHLDIGEANIVPLP